MINIIAKPQKRGKILQKIEAVLKERGVEYRLHITKKRGDAEQIARRLTESGETFIVVVGGDGSLNEVLSGLVDPTVCTLGLIPAGTGNDFAETANIPKGIAALGLILGGEAKETDYLAFSDGRRSINIAGLGIDVDILARCESMKFFHAKSKYFISLLISLIKFHGYELTIGTGEQTKTYNALIAAVCNGKQFGGGIPICPLADIGDGKLDLVVVDCPKRSKLIGALIKLMQGKVLSLPFAHHERCESVTIVPKEPTVAEYDGELHGASSMEATLVHGRLKMYRG